MSEIRHLAIKADLSMSDRQEAITQALRQRLGMSDLYVADLYDDRAIYTTYGDGENAGKSWEVAYTFDGAGEVALDDAATEVERRTVYQAVKFAEDDADGSLIEGMAIPFGGPIKGKDVDGEDFGADTDLCLDWFPEGRPILYHHGLNGNIKTAVVGRQKTVTVEDGGAFVQGELDKRSRWYGRVKRLIDAGALGFSSGAMAHLVKSTKSGHITRWPWVELSLTPTPAHPGAFAYAVKGSAGAFFTSDGNDSENESYTDHGRRVLADVGGFLERTEDRVAARVKQADRPGRELSAGYRATLAELDDLLAVWAGDIATDREAIKTQMDPAARKGDETLRLENELLESDLRRSGFLD